MNINDLTIGQAKEIAAIFGATNQSATSSGLNSMIGKMVIIRTYTAGVWFGELSEKSGNEVIIKEARRMWRWHAEKSISLSAVSIYGVKQNKSKIAVSVESVWLEAIEIIPCTQEAIISISGALNVEAE